MPFWSNAVQRDFSLSPSEGFHPLAGSCTFRHHSSRTFDGTRRLGLSAFVEVSPHAGQCSVLRSPALLTPFHLDNKQPFNPTQRTGSQRWKLNVKDLDVGTGNVSAFSASPFPASTLKISHVFRKFQAVSPFFLRFFCRWAEFPPKRRSRPAFRHEDCKTFCGSPAVSPTSQSHDRFADGQTVAGRGTDRPCEACPAGAEASQTAGRGKRTVVESRTASASCGEGHCSP